MTIFDVHQKLSLSGVSFVCLFDWESEEERRKHRVAGSSFCLLARSLAYGVFFSLLLLLRRGRRRQRRQEMDALIGGWLAII